MEPRGKRELEQLAVVLRAGEGSGRVGGGCSACTSSPEKMQRRRRRWRRPRIRAYGGERDVDGLRHDSPPLPQKPKIHRLRATSAGGSHRQDSSRRWAWWPRLKRQLHHPERDDVEEVVVAVVPRFPHLTRPCSSLRQGFFLVAGSHCGWHHGLGRCRRDFRVPTPRGVVLVAVAAAGPLLEAENERELSGGEM